MEAENEEQRIRPMNCELKVLSRSDGSAIFTQGSKWLITVTIHLLLANFIFQLQ